MVRVERLGKYELLRHLASGGMARVFLARVDGVGGFARHLVLKTVRPERTEDSSYVTMFLDEARLIAALHHQHIAQVYDVGVADDGTYYLAMEYLHGETVRAILERARDQRERLPLDFSLTVVAAAAAGLHHAHERRGPDGRRLGIVHRDVTPSNVIAGYDGSVKLIDFGIAKAAERSTQTKTGFIKGKAGYMAPEQALGHQVDRRADVFSLGVVLYELTTQTRAFPASSELEVAHRIVRGEVTPPTMVVQGYPVELEDVIMTALARDPDERFGDADAFGYALGRAAQQLGVTTSPAAVTRMMAKLFGARPEPWLVADSDDLEEHETHTGDTASLLDARPLLVSSGNASGPSADAVGFARGTDARPGPMRPRVPTVPLRVTPPPAQIIEDHDDDDDDHMPTVKFVALDEAEIIIEPPPKPARIVASGTQPPPFAEDPPVVPAYAAVLPAPPPPAPALPAIPARSNGQYGKLTEPVTALGALPPRRERPWLVPLIAGSLTAAIVIAIVIGVITAGDGPAAPAAPAAPGAPPTAATAQPLAPPTAPAPASSAPAATPAPAAQPGMVAIRITTTPADATVMLDGERLGRTPLAIERPRRPGKVWLKVRRKGYATKKVEVDLGADVIYDAVLRRSDAAAAE